MNSRQLAKLGVSADGIPFAIRLLARLHRDGKPDKSAVKLAVMKLDETPELCLDDPLMADLATELLDQRRDFSGETATYQTWGESLIDNAARLQMDRACSLPVAVQGALMPDAHLGYGLPIGGVLACHNAVVPYAVGVDIACRMKLSLFDRPVSALDDAAQQLTDALERGTRFGVGSQHETPKHHPVLDEDWTITSTTRNKRDIAWKQLGTSGSGNHFVEFGEVEISDTTPDAPVPAGTYLGLLSHSGSRGAGAAVCQTYSSIARKKLPRHLQDFAYLAWLSLDSEAGQEYWAAMNLMGRYAAANHEVIHNTIAELIGGQIVSTIENHHNFAWIEQHNNRSLVVHRKGATPAGTGVLGVIPGTLADPAYIVRGKGNAASLCSASHGAGRAMSRREANDRYRWKAVAKQLESQHIAVVSTGNDEVPAAYKDIRGVMAAQDDLVEVLGTFQPRIVKMCGDGSKAED